ncbi:MAG: Sua5/YciO/YrdC/YwlC family protein, partial [Chloroflexi bacterium]|nr:Sua5/YciO/YrdC/YwlC family protein [Chloroflexota bacterium]
TSGNLSDEPIAYTDDDARARLAAIADQFLTHDREIHTRADDSVARVIAPTPSLPRDAKKNAGIAGEGVMLVRRSRGYAPEPLRAPIEFRQPLLAVGAHLKNTFCLGKGHYAFVSHHIGDLENYQTLQSFGEGIAHFKRLFDIEPRVIAHDLHPEYLSTKWAQDQVSSVKHQASSGNGLSPVPCPLTLFPVQHHHAHIASVMGEHGLTQTVIGVALDGTGYGTDGTIWGGEFLVADYAGFERAAHLDTLPLLGGEQAIHEVWRLAAAWLDKVYGDEFLHLDIDFVKRLDRAKWRVLKQMAQQHINAPRSSAMGRLFDAVAALVGVRDVANYEAQAAIELEMCADESITETYPIALRADVLCMDDTLRAIVADLQNGVAKSIIASRFHNTIAHAIARVCADIRAARGLNQVALGGGVFQNALLLTRTLAALDAAQFAVFVPSKLPPNDGGLSFGQALIANSVLNNES